jgi:amino acid permease
LKILSGRKLHPTTMVVMITSLIAIVEPGFHRPRCTLVTNGYKYMSKSLAFASAYLRWYTLALFVPYEKVRMDRMMYDRSSEAGPPTASAWPAPMNRPVPINGYKYMSKSLAFASAYLRWYTLALFVPYEITSAIRPRSWSWQRSEWIG